MDIFSILALKKAKSSLSTDTLPAQLQEVGLLPAKVDVTAASYTIPNDNTKFYCFNRANAQTVTIPSGLTEFQVGSTLSIIQIGDGAVTLAAGGGVTIRKSTTTLTISAKNKTVQLIKLAEDDWIAVGSFN